MSRPLVGQVTHPVDLQPAIDALGDAGRRFLVIIADGRKVQPWMIAKAADAERGELNGELKDCNNPA